MHSVESGLPRSYVDTLLADPNKQQAVRDFFDTFDKQVAGWESRGHFINTAENKPVAKYPAVITDNGLLFELYATERRIASAAPEISLWRVAQYEVVNSAARHLAYDTKIRGGLVDLSRGDSEYITLEAFTGQYGRLDAVVRPRLIYGEGRGTLFMFGCRKGASITTPDQAIELFGRSVIGLAHRERARRRERVTHELIAQGAYLLVANFRQYRDAYGRPTLRLVSTSNVESEAFPKARRRAGFEL